MTEHEAHQHTVASACTEGDCPLTHETTFEHDHANGHAHHHHLVDGVELYAGPAYDIVGTQTGGGDMPPAPDPVVVVVPPPPVNNDGPLADLWVD